MKVAGFSLIELMVVIAIVGLLSAVVAPNYSYYIKKSKIAATEPMRNDFNNKIIEYYEIKGHMPAAVSDIGLTGTYSSYPDSIPSLASEYAVVPSLMFESFGGQESAPGQCAYFQTAQYVSNYDNTGAYTTLNDTAHYVSFINVYIKSKNNVWQKICQLSDTDSASGEVRSEINNTCYNGNSIAGQDSFMAEFNALSTACP